MTVRMTAPGGGEAFSAGPMRFRILDDGTSTDGRGGVIEQVFPPAWPGPPQHVHREHDETFFVLSGVVRFTSGTDELLAPAGSLVVAPRGDPHTFANADRESWAGLLITVTPERYLGYFRELQHLSPEPDGRMPRDQVLEIMARYATEPYRPG